MKQKILIFGNGQIGAFYKSHFDKIGVKAEIANADITDLESVEREISSINPDVVINTAAKTNLEWCANNKLETFNTNVLGADNIAQTCDKHGVYFIHFSSGCIFESKDFNDAKKETSIPAPAAYYSWTKVWSEQLVQFNKSRDFKYIILRPRQPISSQFNYKNTLVKLLTFTKFIDTPNTVTVLEDLMEWTTKIIETKPVGVLNVANEGWTTPYKEALLLKKYILPGLPIEKITKSELNKLTPNKRVDTILDVTKLKRLVGKVDSIDQKLEKIIIELGNNLKAMSKEDISLQLEKTIQQSKTRTVVNDQWPSLYN
ncbi:NAD-dependent epimerase/dehydratase family protein [candidate division WWE3 bacterium]|jgi:dTDP-4-dehydrorhamnose reductase|uniref:dTDP-4-dehydrorhamnose reductase n=1 Tax=candidate division WWE3 bacterium TaxID=2053526 RepID=A0A3A4ZJ04_UNCKA|nr:MAG: NAD-dependent epimerase/dehydratase family protein [candidate division WWE3 bacterium]